MIVLLETKDLYQFFFICKYVKKKDLIVIYYNYFYRIFLIINCRTPTNICLQLLIKINEN